MHPDVVHLTAEYWPFVRTGGLGEAVHGLATRQHRDGARVWVLLPLYSCVRDRVGDLEPVAPPLRIPLGDRIETVRILARKRGGEGPTVLFLEQPGLFARTGVYGEGGDYPDNHLRFAVLCRAAVDLLPSLSSDRPLVLHGHDWHSALAPLFLRYRAEPESPNERVASVLSVHNGSYQGCFPRSVLGELPFGEACGDAGPGLECTEALAWGDSINLLKGGILSADAVTTVSPTHAFELRTEAGGFGLDPFFRSLGGRLSGILNGIDPDLWNPANDPHIPSRYTRDRLEGKAACKAALQREFGLSEDPSLPLFAMAARFVEQKGIDLVIRSTELRRPGWAQFVFMGNGEPRFERALLELARDLDHVAVRIGFCDEAEHRLLAGADLLLMPSLYEPCGLTQMRAQRYGAVPLARRVGGLADTIHDGATGLLFDTYDPGALDAGLVRARRAFAEPETWQELVRSGMQTDFGWGGSAARHLEIYRAALGRRSALLCATG